MDAKQTSTSRCGLRRLLFLGNVEIEGSSSTQNEAYVLSYNLQERKPDRVRLLSPHISDTSQISSHGFGPYDNGHLLLGLQSGHLLGFDVNNNFEIVFSMQLCQYPLSSIQIDPTNLVLVTCAATKKMFAVSLIDKKFEYVYLELGLNQYCTVQLDHQKHKEALLKNAKAKRQMRAPLPLRGLKNSRSNSPASEKPSLKKLFPGELSKKTPKMDFRKSLNLKSSMKRRDWTTSSQHMPETSSGGLATQKTYMHLQSM